MKKIVTGLLVAGFLAVGFSGTVSAESPKTDVTGVVTENHVAVANANVTVECEGNTEMDVTDAHGAYLATFASADCPFGSTVKVTAQKDGKSGVASNTVQGITTKLNLAIVNVSIPEYGLISSIMAGGLGIGLIGYMRHRQQRLQF